MYSYPVRIQDDPLYPYYAEGLYKNRIENGRMVSDYNDGQSVYSNLYRDVPYHLVFESGETVSGTVEAHTSVEIKDGAIVSPSAHIKAGERIIVDPEVTIPAEAILEIATPFPSCGSNSNYAATDLELANFCSSSKYKPKVPALMLAYEPGDKPAVEDPEEFIFVDLYPNPANSEWVTLEVDLHDDQELSVEVLDVRSISLYQGIAAYYPEGRHVIHIPIDNLQPGIYVVMLYTSIGPIQRRLVVQ